MFHHGGVIYTLSDPRTKEVRYVGRTAGLAIGGAKGG